MSGAKRLDPRHLRFIDEYLSDPDGNATQAAIRAGYSERSAKQRASEVLNREDVAAEIARRRAIIARTADMTAADILQQYEAVARAEITDVVRWCNEAEVSEDGKTLILKGVIFTVPSHELPPHVRRAIKSVKQTANGIVVEMHDKNPALAKLEIYKQMEGAGDRHVHTGPGGGPIRTESTTRFVFEVVDPAHPPPAAAGHGGSDAERGR